MPARPAIVCADEVVTYEQLDLAVKAIAAQLHAAGVRQGDCVGLAMKDHPTHLIAHYAVAFLGSVILPIDHRWTISEQQAAALAFRAKIVVTDGLSYPCVPVCTVQRDTRAATPALVPADGPLDLLVALSSGTTGKPSGAYVTQRQMYERFVAQWVTIGFDSNDCFAVVTPLYYGAGRSFAMSMLAAGGTVWLAPPPHEDAGLVELLRRPTISATFLPPTMLRRLLLLARTGKSVHLPNLRYVIVSGEPFRRVEAEKCRDAITSRLFGYYASSEGGGICVLKPEELVDYAHTAGRPIFGVEVQIVDDEGREAAPGTAGRVRYRGPGVADRILDGEGLPVPSEAPGWFYPGDLAVRLESGHIELRGRCKDVIIRGGVNIYPAEIEAVLLEHPAIVEAAVVGSPSIERGQEVTAYVVSPLSWDLQSLLAHCRRKLAPYKIPKEFIRLDSLPKEPSGKVSKGTLRTWSGADHS
jgi:acyl-CoA synthetase (AMP-forming)/AMP-acid ligase II